MVLRRTPEALLVLVASLVVLVPAGCAKKDTVTNPRSGPTANFAATPRSGDRPLDVDFTDLSIPGTSAITSSLWSFGDGATSTDRNTGHLYGAPGTYTVSLRVTTAEGADTETKADFIVVTDGGALPPNAAFSATPTGGPAPVSVQFTDESTSGSATISSRSWNFGDGGTSTARNPSHIYAVNGTYTVSLAVTTSVGTDTETKTDYIVVSPAPVPPTADFSGSPTEGVAPLSVDFTDDSAPGSATITSRAWTFGDGGTSSVENPSHTYAAAGSYTVGLTVTTSVGSDSESKTGYVTVTPAPVPPTAQFSGAPNNGPAPLAVQFSDQSIAGTSPITSFAWTFGDGGTSSVSDPEHTYGTPGTYSVSLTVTTADGQDSETKADYIVACERPTADFAGLPTTGVAPLLVQFTDLSTPGDVASWSWDFGDGGASAVRNPIHVYSTPGTYDVSLRAVNACGRDTTTKTGYITVTEACPDPVYTIANAFWSTITDTDRDGYLNRARLNWNADVGAGCIKSVFAKVYYRAQGDTAWTLAGQTGCYTITEDSSFDTASWLFSGLPRDTYDFQIELYECSGTTVKAVLGPADDPDLTGQRFEP